MELNATKLRSIGEYQLDALNEYKYAVASRPSLAHDHYISFL